MRVAPGIVVAVVVVVVAAACGKREPSAPAPASVEPLAAAAIDAAPPPTPSPDAAPRPPFANDPSADARALGAALAELDPDATKAWIDRAQAPRYEEGPPFDEAPPPEAARAIDALVAWDRSGAFLTVGCNSAEETAALRILYVARAALETAADADDRVVHAVLRLGQALRSRDNSTPAIGVGIEAARSTSEWLFRRHLSVTDDVRALAPEADVAARAARADARCKIAGVAAIRTTLRDPAQREPVKGMRREWGLSANDQDVDADLAAFDAFVRETQRQLDRAETPAEVGRISLAREEASQRQRESVLVQALGTSYAYTSMSKGLDQYRAAYADAAGLPAPSPSP